MGLYHEMLGVPEDAGIDLIKSRYRALCKKYHPDLNDEESIGKMALVNEAYGALVRGIDGRGTVDVPPPGAPPSAAAGKAATIRENQDYLFYRQGFRHFNGADDNLAFRDANEWDGRTREYSRKETLAAYERDLYRALYCFNIVCVQFPESPWRDDALEKIKLLNQKRSYLSAWKSRAR